MTTIFPSPCVAVPGLCDRGAEPGHAVGPLIEEQLAADVLFPDQPELMPALGFLVSGPYDASAAGTAPMSFEIWTAMTW